MTFSCETCREHLSEWLESSDSESSNTSARLHSPAEQYSSQEEMDAHLKSCASCAGELALLRAARDELRALPMMAAPADLRARIRAELETENKIETAPPARFVWPEWLSFRRPMRVVWAGGLAVAVMGAALTTYFRESPPTNNKVSDTIIAPAPKAPMPRSKPSGANPAASKTRAAKNAPAPKADNSKPTMIAETSKYGKSNRAVENTKNDSDDKVEAPRSLNGNRIAMGEAPVSNRERDNHVAREETPREEGKPPVPQFRDTIQNKPKTRQVEPDTARSSNIETNRGSAPAPAIAPDSVLRRDVTPKIGEPSASSQRIEVAPPASAVAPAPRQFGRALSGAAGPAGPAGALDADAAPNAFRATEEPLQSFAAPVAPGGFGMTGAAKVMERAAPQKDEAEKPKAEKPKPTPTPKPKPKKEAPAVKPSKNEDGDKAD